MADIHIWRMTGAGEVNAYKVVSGNDQLLGTTVNGNGTFTYNIGDTFKFVSVPGSGYVFQKYCNSDPCTTDGTITTNTFTGTISQQTGNLYVYFVVEQGTINIIRSSGIGEVNAYKVVSGNDQLLGTTVNGNGTFTYNIGDIFKFVSVPGSGYVFQKYCSSDPCTTDGTITTNTFTGTVTQSSGNLYVYFATSETSGESSLLALVAGVAVLGILMSSKKQKQNER